MSEQRAEGFWWVRVGWGVQREAWAMAWVGIAFEPVWVTCAHFNGLWPSLVGAIHARIIEWGPYLGTNPEECKAEHR